MSNEERVSRRQFLKTAGITTGSLAATGTLISCTQQQLVPPQEVTESGDATAGTAGQGAAAAPAAAQESGPWAMGNQIEDIRSRGSIVIGTTMRFPPQAYHDPDTNEPAGYDIEVGNLLAQDLEVEAQWEDVEWDALLPGLVSGKYDLIINGIANKPSRALSMQFTRGYVPYDQILLVQADTDDVPWQELNAEGVKVTAQEGATAEFRAREAFSAAEIVPLKVPEVMLEVAAGRADACLIEAYLALPFAANHPSTRVLLDPATGEPQHVAREWGCMPTRPGEHAFMHFIDNWLAWYWERGTLDAMYDRIVGPTLRGEVTWE
jgi:ABC-type amino acid transport substrate-binding protein